MADKVGVVHELFSRGEAGKLDRISLPRWTGNQLIGALDYRQHARFVKAIDILGLVWLAGWYIENRGAGEDDSVRGGHIRFGDLA